MEKKNSVLILTTNPDFPTNNHLEKSLKSLGYNVYFENPYHGTCCTEPLFLKNPPQIVINRCGGLNFDDLDLTYSCLYRDHGSLVINPPDSVILFRNKDYQLAYLKGLELPIIPSLFVRDHQLEYQSLKFLENQLEGQTPVACKENYILKNIRGQGGKGVMRIKGRQALRDVIETRHFMGDQRYLLQPFLPVEKEYRVYFAGQEPIFAISKKALKGEKHNLAEAKFEDLDIVSIPTEILKHLKELSELPLFFYSVDWIQTTSKHGNHFFLLEVNTFPGLHGAQDREKLIHNLTLSIQNHVNYC